MTIPTILESGARTRILDAGDIQAVSLKKMLDLMEYDVPYTSNDIMDRLGLKSKETLRKNYINPAIELGLIRMTIPDKPNSKNQRYVKV